MSDQAGSERPGQALIRALAAALSDQITSARPVAPDLAAAAAAALAAAEEAEGEEKTEQND